MDTIGSARGTTAGATAGATTELVTGPVALLALSFPTHRVDAAVVESVAEVVERRDARVLDLVVVLRDDDGSVRVADVDDRLAEHGLTRLAPEAGLLMSDDDVDAIADTLRPGEAAVLIAYENVWAARVAAAVRECGGDVALHVHIPVDVVRAALAADSATAATT